VSARRTFVVVGGGLTAGAAVTTLRQEGFDGRIVVIGDEPHPPYERPPLSKEFLQGTREFAESLLHPTAWYEEQDVDLLLGRRATAIDLQGRRVEVDGGDRIAYDALLLATGARNRRPPLPGLELDGVLQLRTIEEARDLRDRARPGTHAVVVGGGFIGSEVAASIRQRGVEVDLLEPGPVPLKKVLGPEIGEVVARIHQEHGVRLHTGIRVERFEGAGRVEVAVSTEGRRFPCDLAVLGIGVEPNVELAEAAGLQVANGIVVDEVCRTPAPGVTAAGDVANHRHPVFGPIRVEHFDNALKMGTHAGHAMLGSEAPFDDPHWFWSDQYELNIQYLGFATTWDRVVVRGSLEDRRFVAFYLDGGVVRGVVGFDRGRDVRRAAALVRAARPVDPEALADEGVDLRSLAKRFAAPVEARAEMAEGA
jgi:3-phenylpropionate/trans-cinnamate dioxygenase ferredoxin reductase subunit